MRRKVLEDFYVTEDKLLPDAFFLQQWQWQLIPRKQLFLGKSDLRKKHNEHGLHFIVCTTNQHFSTSQTLSHHHHLQLVTPYLNTWHQILSTTATIWSLLTSDLDLHTWSSHKMRLHLKYSLTNSWLNWNQVSESIIYYSFNSSSINVMHMLLKCWFSLSFMIAN